MKKILVALVAMILIDMPLLVSVSTAGNGGVVNNNGRVNLAALEEMLTKGLKATREDEKLYIKDVVMKMVEDEKLPVSLVYASFTYARKRRPDYPFPYFQYSLKTLANRKHIELYSVSDSWPQ
jgi:siroheme synthase (precorrin-2 oxidase/ferrochelatase)